MRFQESFPTGTAGYSAPAPTTAAPCVCVVGVGFVGESLLSEFGSHYSAIGFDVSPKRVAHLKNIFKSYSNVTVTTDEAELDRATHYLISVPTLLKDDNTVDTTYLTSAISTVLKHVQPGNSIVIESSVSVGTTRQLLGKYSNTLHCGMSPERVDPGRTIPAAHEIPKIISGLTPAALEELTSLYGKVYQQMVPVSKPEVAEMTKLFENCYRMINIAYVNEMADAARSHGIDPNEMIDAASTKPYGYTAFRPGMGVGGHCIPVNPFYLFANNPRLPVLKRATHLMRNRPAKLAKKFHRTCGSAPRILVVGMGFKPGQSVLSYSPGVAFADELNKLGCEKLAFYDPLVAQEQIPWMQKADSESWAPENLMRDFDAVAICMKQHEVDLDVLNKLPQSMVRFFDN